MAHSFGSKSGHSQKIAFRSSFWSRPPHGSSSEPSRGLAALLPGLAALLQRGAALGLRRAEASYGFNWFWGVGRKMMFRGTILDLCVAIPGSSAPRKPNRFLHSHIDTTEKQLPKCMVVNICRPPNLIASFKFTLLSRPWVQCKPTSL